MLDILLIVIALLLFLVLVFFPKKAPKHKRDAVIVAYFVDGEWKFLLKDKPREEYGKTQVALKQL